MNCSTPGLPVHHQLPEELEYNCFTTLCCVSRHSTTKWISYYVCACGLGRFSPVRLFATLWTVARQAPLSMNSPGKNTGVGCHALLQGIFSTHPWNSNLLHCRRILYPMRHLGSPSYMYTYIRGKKMATYSSILAWRIPWTEEPGGLLSMGSHRVGHDWSNLAAAAYIYIFSLLDFLPPPPPSHPSKSSQSTKLSSLCFTAVPTSYLFYPLVYIS